MLILKEIPYVGECVWHFLHSQTTLESHWIAQHVQGGSSLSILGDFEAALCSQA